MDYKNIVVIGSNGQVGSAICQKLSEYGVAYQAVDREQLDLSEINNIDIKLSTLAPDFLINAAAFTNVDLAEEEKSLCHKVNTVAPGRMALWCAQNNIPFVHFSTDYVFSGASEEAYTETHATEPVNHYGFTKEQSEKLISEIGGKWIILRTSWVYSNQGKNFLNTVVRLSRQLEELKIVNDQRGSPTLASDIAEVIFKIINQTEKTSEFPVGIYHVTNSGETTWFDFANAIIKRKPGTSKRVIPISTAEHGAKANRPNNSTLSNKKLKDIFHIELRSWQSALEDCLSKAGS